ncbi:MAG: PepSY domain-containing protein [Clostridiales bacterium]|nr:PepSY domain-containing protein [Clostridiales bacterium]
MKKNFKNTLNAVSIAALSALLLTGCGANSSETSTAAPAADTTADTTVAGTVLLSVNPEIEVDYNQKGMVVEIEGLNEDGKKIIGGYSDYKGSECDAVINELVKKIYESGYFDQTVGGNTKNIVIKLEEGSSYPDEAFLEEIAQGVQNTVKEWALTTSPMTIDHEDYDENGYIGLDKAKELVLAQLGIQEASFTEKDYELDDGVYELEFTANGTEYEFEVDAVSGKVLEADYENNDDWNTSDDVDDDLDDIDDVNDDRHDIDDDNDLDDINDDYDDIDDDSDDVNDDYDDVDDHYDDIDDDYDDVNDDYDDVDDHYDDIDDDYDDVNDDYDDVDDHYDDINDDYDDVNDDYDDVDDDDDDVNDDYDDIDDHSDDVDDWDDDDSDDNSDDDGDDD